MRVIKREGKYIASRWYREETTGKLVGAT